MTRIGVSEPDVIPGDLRVLRGDRFVYTARVWRARPRYRELSSARKPAISVAQSSGNRERIYAFTLDLRC